jgi:hypothetical protein
VTVAASPPPHPPPLPPQPSPANIIITITIINTNIIIIIIIHQHHHHLLSAAGEESKFNKKQKLKPCLFKSAALFLVLEFPVSTIRQRRSFLCLYEA